MPPPVRIVVAVVVAVGHAVVVFLNRRSAGSAHVRLFYGVRWRFAMRSAGCSKTHPILNAPSPFGLEINQERTPRACSRILFPSRAHDRPLYKCGTGFQPLFSPARCRCHRNKQLFFKGRIRKRPPVTGARRLPRRGRGSVFWRPIRYFVRGVHIFLATLQNASAFAT